MKMTTGYIKDQPDFRDFNAKQLVPLAIQLPYSYDVNPYPVIYNQGSEPSCVCYASAGIKTDQELAQYKQRYTFDGSWLYRECKKIDGIPDQSGTYPRIALKVMNEQGMKIGGWLSFLYKPDMKWRIKAYFRLYPGIELSYIKQIIFQYGSLLAASWWYNSWNSAKDILPVPDTQYGAHAYKISGWNDAFGFKVTNSWGSLWGRNGSVYMPYNMFLKEVIENGDCWKLVDQL